MVKPKDLTQFIVRDIEDVLAFICIVNNNILKKDVFWHFFDEEELGIFIRCSEKSADKLEEWLNACDYDFTRGEYIEDHPMVNTYFNYFALMFHCNALIAIDFYNDISAQFDDSVDDKELIKSHYVGSIAERLSHCFLNNLKPFTKKYKIMAESRFGDSTQWESYVLSELLIDRSAWTGLRQSFLNARKEHDLNEER
jgi:hypothetical protein